MNRLSIAAATVAALYLGSAPAQAQSVMLEYFTSLSERDTYNSQGVPLNDVCAIVQQDRANVHRFGLIDQGDQIDGFFTTPERRAMITGRCSYDPNHHTVARIRGNIIGYVFVRVYGSGGMVTLVEIQEAAG